MFLQFFMQLLSVWNQLFFLVSWCFCTYWSKVAKLGEDNKPFPEFLLCCKYLEYTDLKCRLWTQETQSHFSWAEVILASNFLLPDFQPLKHLWDSGLWPLYHLESLLCKERYLEKVLSPSLPSVCPLCHKPVLRLKCWGEAPRGKSLGSVFSLREP